MTIKAKILMETTMEKKAVKKIVILGVRLIDLFGVVHNMWIARDVILLYPHHFSLSFFNLNKAMDISLQRPHMSPPNWMDMKEFKIQKVLFLEKLKFSTI